MLLLDEKQNNHTKCYDDDYDEVMVGRFKVIKLK